VKVSRAFQPDAALTALTAPKSGIDLTSAEAVTVTVKNTGNQALSNIPVHYEINGQLTGSGTVKGPLAVQAETSYTFDTKADLSAARPYTVKAYTSLSGDNNAANDVAVAQVTNFGTCSVSTFPFADYFESLSDIDCWRIYDKDGNGLQWELYPIIHVKTGKYNIRHKDSESDQDGWLVTPKMILPADKGCKLSFSSWNIVFMGFGKNSILVSEGSPDPDVGPYTEIWSQTSGNTEWETISVSLEAYKGKEVYIAFRYESPGSHSWYLDDVTVEAFSGKDAGVIAVNAPKSGGNLTDAETVTVKVKNFGYETLNSIPVSYAIDGQSAVSETITESVAGFQEITYSFSKKADLSTAGDHALKVYTSLSGDGDPGNDAKTVTVSNYGECEISSFPLEEGFENEADLNCWTSIYPGPLNPPRIVNSDYITPHSGDYVWRFSSFYGNGLGADRYVQYLITPKLDDAEAKMIQFYYYVTPSYFYHEEKFKVGYSTTDNQPGSFIWTDSIAASKSQWASYSHIVPAGAKYVAIAYVPPTSNFYLFIDDLKIGYIPMVEDAAVTKIISPLKGGDGQAQVKAEIRNLGGKDITSMNVAYRFNGGDPVVQAFTGTIAPATSIEFTFNRTVDVSEYNDNYTVEVYTLLANDNNVNNDTAFIRFLYRESALLYGYRRFDELLYANWEPFEGAVSFNSGDPVNVATLNYYRDDSAGKFIITAGEYIDGYIYAFSTDFGNPGNFIKLTPEWEEVFKAPVSEFSPQDVTYDHSTGTLYAVIGSQLYTVDIVTGNFSRLTTLSRYLFTIACDLSGKLYGIDSYGNFSSINKTTGRATVIGNTGIIPKYEQSMAFDHHSGRLFWAMSGTEINENGKMYDQGRLFEIDPATGSAALLGVIGAEAQIVALYTPYSATGIEKPESNSRSVLVYPNPSRGEVHISAVPENASIRIVDLSGRIVDRYEALSGDIQLNLNLTHGIYFIQIEKEGEKIVRKLIIK
jgi:hypothetical protein